MLVFIKTQLRYIIPHPLLTALVLHLGIGHVQCRHMSYHANNHQHSPDAAINTLYGGPVLARVISRGEKNSLPILDGEKIPRALCTKITVPNMLGTHG